MESDSLLNQRPQNRKPALLALEAGSISSMRLLTRSSASKMCVHVATHKTTHRSERHNHDKHLSAETGTRQVPKPLPPRPDQRWKRSRRLEDLARSTFPPLRNRSLGGCRGSHLCVPHRRKTGKPTTIAPSTTAVRALIPRRFICVPKTGLNPSIETHRYFRDGGSWSHRPQNRGG